MAWQPVYEFQKLSQLAANQYSVKRDGGCNDAHPGRQTERDTSFATWISFTGLASLMGGGQMRSRSAILHIVIDRHLSASAVYWPK
ncbi:MAG: hypothetical protein MI923_01895 [Phycisphaerales bacterium]|nr:hypothetical protein [Phycisphaerales bacterium]